MAVLTILLSLLLRK